MANNGIKLKPISELLGMNFFIPSYQRGYRWDKQQVDDLLKDIYDFATKDKLDKNEFYCLQPIVVKKFEEDEKTKNNLDSQSEWYEVIDGQQRLTTIRIILSYFESDFGGKMVDGKFVAKTLIDKYGKPNFNLEYQTRPNTKDFLDNIAIANADTMDCYFIKQSYNNLKILFEGDKSKTPEIPPKFSQKDSAITSIINTLVIDEKNKKAEGLVKVIWYEIKDDKNPIDTFIRINMGKIPLTNAELIKALFLQKRNFGSNEIAESQQIIIANEWDKIEYSFQNEEFWWFLNKDQNDMPARIEFLFDLICEIEKQNNKSVFEIEYGTDKYTTFRYFNAKFSNDMTFDKVKKEWDKIHDYYLAFQEWYNTPVWYHYIGFLIYCKISVIVIYNLYKGKNKEDFTKALIKEIKKTITISCEKKEDNYLIVLPFENKNKEQIRRLLLLFNIEFINKQYNEITKLNKTQDDENFIIKFPFKLFKAENWDVEHIDSQTPNTGDEKEWLETAKEDLADELLDNNNKELADNINSFLTVEKTKIQFADLYKKICILSGEVENDEETKNSIGNLTLLNAEINRSYGNALFPTKRRIIIEKDMDGKFIPICTKHVFLKYFDKKGTTRTKWGKDDIQNYQNHIVTILSNFLTIKIEQGGSNNE